MGLVSGGYGVPAGITYGGNEGRAGDNYVGWYSLTASVLLYNARRGSLCCITDETGRAVQGRLIAARLAAHWSWGGDIGSRSLRSTCDLSASGEVNSGLDAGADGPPI